MDEDRRRRIEDMLWMSQHQERILWVRECGHQMASIKVGMTREELLDVFTPDGGISGPTKGVFVYRRCPYFKVVVTFRPFREKDEQGRIKDPWHPQDIITEINGPFVLPWVGGA
jgi:hypothetical protein